ncbi:hypothetical protein FGRMN_5461 [Fusarium graminum]|nr:hypothetical protein FGRMN_5461 [Fusarium graminum]
MELTMAAQHDASAWQSPTPTGTAAPDQEGSLLGRACFSRTGIVRRKPARGDAPPTLSKSCSDKIALKQCTSLLSSLTSVFVDPANAYIQTLILPKSQYSETACRRSFSVEGRMNALVDETWLGGYSFREFSVVTTDLEFGFSKRAVKARADKISASNLAAVWSHSGFEENIIGGVIQGRKAFRTNGASRTSRRSMWEVASELAGRLGESYYATATDLACGTYRDFKEGRLTLHRQQVKNNARKTALMGWIRNDGGSDFQLEKT